VTSVSRDSCVRLLPLEFMIQISLMYDARAICLLSVRSVPAKVDAGSEPRSVLHIHRTLSKALKQATDDGLIPRNAAGVVKPPRPRREEIRPLDRE
jgi:hypothetical protein